MLCCCVVTLEMKRWGHSVIKCQLTQRSVCTGAYCLLLAEVAVSFSCKPSRDNGELPGLTASRVPPSRSGCFSPFAYLPGCSMYKVLIITEVIDVVIDVQSSHHYRGPIVYTVEKDHLRVYGILKKAQKWVSMPTSLWAQGSYSKMGFPNRAATWTVPRRLPDFSCRIWKGGSYHQPTTNPAWLLGILWRANGTKNLEEGSKQQAMQM